MSPTRSTRWWLAALALSASACSDGKTYLLVKLTSNSSLTASRFVVDLGLANTALKANTVFTPASPVSLPPEQQLALVLAGDPSGRVDVSVRAENAAGPLSTASGSVTIVPHTTNTLALTFGGVSVDGGADDGGVSADLLPGPDMASVPPATFTIVPSVTTVNEHESFNLHMEAKNAAGQIETGYNGTPSLKSSWGDIGSLAPPVFSAGVCDLAVSLNRETHPGFAGAIVTVFDGLAVGNSAEITVTVDTWHVDGTAVRIHVTYTKSGMTLSENAHPGAVISAASGGGYRLIGDATVHMGGPAAANSFAIWTSPDGIDWTRSGGFLTMADSVQGVVNTSLVWDGSMYRALWTGTDATATAHLLGATSLDTVVWTQETPVAAIDFKCSGSTVAFLYGAGSYQRLQGSAPVCNVDGGGAGSENMGMLTAGVPWAGRIQEGTVSKIWAISGGMTYYATSGDGINWVSSSAAYAAPVYAVYWNNERKQPEGFIDQGGQSYYRAFRQ